MLRLQGLTYRIGGRTVLDGATARIPARTRVALVGRNGAGKTSLLRLIEGLAEPDAGTIEMPRGAVVASVAQQAPDGPESLIETVLAADRPRAEALAALADAEAAGDGGRIGALHARLEEIDAHAAPARAAAILAGLGFADEEMGRACAELSGGWRMRVALAAALVRRADILLLDEPTNHLDFEATAWLESHLARFPGTLVLVSHDREMLDRIAERVLHLEDGKLTDYRGNYTAFERALAERQAADARAADALAAERRRMQAFIDRFRAKATKARQAQSRIKALERLGPELRITQRRPVVLDFPEPEPLAPPLVTLAGAATGYDGTAVLRRLDLQIDADDRIALLGPNGNGKSTLMRLLAGRLDAMAGTVRRSPRLRVGYFAQHQLDELDPAASAYDNLRRLDEEAPEPRLRAHLARFGLAGSGADTAVAELSGGEKARLLLALMSRETPQLLLLDEPTNHLDIEARAALVRALNAYPGAVVLVSHDPFLIEHLADRLWLVAAGTCRPFDGDLEDYRRAVLETRRESRRPAQPVSGRGDRKAERRQAAEARQQLAPLRRAVEAAEAAVERLGGELAAIDTRLADARVYAGPADALQDLLKRQGALKKEIAEAEARWLAAAAALEDADGG